MLSRHQYHYFRLLHYPSCWRTSFHIYPHISIFLLLIIIIFFKKLGSLYTHLKFSNGFPTLRDPNFLRWLSRHAYFSIFTICHASSLCPAILLSALLPVFLRTFICCLCFNTCPSGLHITGLDSSFIPNATCLVMPSLIILHSCLPITPHSPQHISQSEIIIFSNVFHLSH